MLTYTCHANRPLGRLKAVWNLIDLHTHILPGVDDGVSDDAEALETLRQVAAAGITHVVATPHVITGVYTSEPDAIREGTARLQELADGEGVAVRVLPGAEYYLEPEVLERHAQGRLITLNDAGRYVLVELPAQEVPGYVEQLLFNLVVEGLTPVLAHPERNMVLMHDPGRLYRLVQRGVLVQVTAGGLLGVFGREVRCAAEVFIRHRWVHFMASDLHGLDARLEAMGEVGPKLTALVGPAEADRILVDNPQAVLEGRALTTTEPLEWTPRVGFVRRLWRRLSRI